MLFFEKNKVFLPDIQIIRYNEQNIAISKEENEMKCPNCNSNNTGERFSKESVSLVYDYVCNDCECLFNDEEDFIK